MNENSQRSEPSYRDDRETRARVKGSLAESYVHGLAALRIPAEEIRRHVGGRLNAQFSTVERAYKEAVLRADTGKCQFDEYGELRIVGAYGNFHEVLLNAHGAFKNLRKDVGMPEPSYPGGP